MKAVDSLDLDPIKVKLMDAETGEGWSFEKVESAEIRYRRFLTLCQENPKTPLVPTQDIDKFWHYHILDTSKYADDCQIYFGYFLHHFPYFGLRSDDDERDLAEAFEATKALYKARFNENYVGGDIKSSSADCMVGCGDVVCKPGNCSSIEIRPKYHQPASAVQ